MKMLCFSLVLMALFADSYGRSLTPKKDVPDPQKRVSARLPPPVVLHSAQVKSLARDKVPGPAEMNKLSVAPHVKLNVKDKIPAPVLKKSKVPVSLQVKSNMKVSLHPSAEAPLHVLSKMKSTKPIKSQVQAKPDPESRGHSLSFMKVTSNAQTSSKGDGLKPADSKGGMFFHKPGNRPNEGNITTPLMTTTTVDPWDEYCKEACEAGMAGPECDCAGHPIGRRDAPLLEPESPVAEAESQPMQQYHPRSVRASHPNQYRGNEEVSTNVQLSRLLI